jgi:hypothetical protein
LIAHLQELMASGVWSPDGHYHGVPSLLAGKKENHPAPARQKRKGKKGKEREREREKRKKEGKRTKGGK